MISFINNAETRRIDRIVSKHFMNNSWRVSSTERSHEPVLKVTKRDVSFFVKSIDFSTINFIGISRLTDRLEQFALDYRSRTGEVIAYVVAQPLRGIDLTRLAARGIALFTIAELPTLIAVELVHGSELNNLDDRIRRVVQGCTSLCVALSEEAANANNVDDAKGWLDLNLDGVRLVLETRHKLVDLLRKEGRSEDAKKVAWDGIAISGHNRDF